VHDRRRTGASRRSIAHGHLVSVTGHLHTRNWSPPRRERSPLHAVGSSGRSRTLCQRSRHGPLLERADSSHQMHRSPVQLQQIELCVGCVQLVGRSSRLCEPQSHLDAPQSHLVRVPIRLPIAKARLTAEAGHARDEAFPLHRGRATRGLRTPSALRTFERDPTPPNPFPVVSRRSQ
jgi:hypothetical protein